MLTIGEAPLTLPLLMDLAPPLPPNNRDDAETASLLERDHELTSLRERVDAARRGEGGLVMIAGPAGIGKSSLLAVAARYARDDGLTVGRGRGSELEQELPFGVLRQLLEPYVAALSATRQGRLFTGAAAGSRQLVLGGGGAGGDDFVTLHALFWLIAGIAADAPLLLVLDDLHWADAPSVRALNYLTGRISELPVLLVMALRPHEPTGVADLIRPLESTPGATRLELAGLGPDSVERVVRATVPDAEKQLCGAFGQATGGNPFYLRQLLQTLTAGGARPAVTDVRAAALTEVGDRTLARLRSLGRAAPALAMAMATLGDSGRLDHATAVAGVEHDAAADAALAMRRLEILAAEDPFEWIHPLVRRSLYDGLSVTRRDALHARAAEVLAEAGLPPGVVAAHLAALRPSGSDAVVNGLLAAVDEALARNAPEVAIDLLHRALAEDAGSRVRLLLRLGEIEVSRRSPAAVEVLREARELADDPRERALAALRLGEILTHVGYYHEAVSTVCDGLAELDGADPEVALELEVARAVSFAFDPALSPQLWDDRGRLLALTERDAWPARALAALLALTYAFRAERLDEISTLCERALEGGQLLGERGAGAWTPGHVTQALIIVEEHDRALALTDEIEAAARSQGSASNVLLAEGLRGNIAVLRGDLTGAEETLRPLAETSQSLGWLLGLITALWWMGDVIMERPADDDLADLLDAFEVPPGFEAVAPGAWALLIRGVFAPSAVGETTPRRICARRGPCSTVWDSVRCTTRGARIWHWSSRPPNPTRRRRSSPRSSAQRTRPVSREPRAIALRASGVVTGGDCRHRDAGGVERRCSTATPGALSPCPRARRSRRLTASQWPGWRNAREPLRAGLELALACGAERLLVRARDELVATGARPRGSPAPVSRR